MGRVLPGSFPGVPSSCYSHAWLSVPRTMILKPGRPLVLRLMTLLLGLKPLVHAATLFPSCASFGHDLLYSVVITRPVLLTLAYFFL